MQNKKYLLNKTRKELGFTAIELLFALGIIAVATVVIVKMMGNNSDKAKAQQMIADVTAITNNIRAAYNGSSYTNLDTTAAITEKVIPSDLNIVESTTVNNQFSGGTVTIASVTDGSFSITYTNVPASVCNEVITHIGNDNFLSISAGGQDVYSGGGSIDPKIIADGCSAGSSVVFTAS